MCRVEAARQKGGHHTAHPTHALTLCIQTIPSTLRPTNRQQRLTSLLDQLPQLLHRAPQALRSLGVARQVASTGTQAWWLAAAGLAARRLAGAEAAA